MRTPQGSASRADTCQSSQQAAGRADTCQSPQQAAGRADTCQSSQQAAGRAETPPTPQRATSRAQASPASMVWDRLAPKYDRLWVQRHSLKPTRITARRILAAYAAKHPSRVLHILDLGCGTGQLLAEIHADYPTFHLYGMDKASEMLAMARDKKVPAQLWHRDIALGLPEASNASEAHPAPEAWDVIFCCHSFPYYPNPEQTLQEIRDRLRPGGMVVLIQSSINTLYDRLIFAAVEKTAEKAAYLSRRDFLRLATPDLRLEQAFPLKTRRFMPSIYCFILRKDL